MWVSDGWRIYRKNVEKVKALGLVWECVYGVGAVFLINSSGFPAIINKQIRFLYIYRILPHYIINIYIYI